MDDHPPWVLSLVVLLLLLPPVAHAQQPGTCISESDAELLTLVDGYREANGLAQVPWSRSLITVGQWHVWDAVNNDPVVGSCNLHSWSDTRPGLWTEVCYTPDHANAALMWSKPAEITHSLYTAYGFENAAWGYPSVSSALNGWKNSSGHNDVILNRNIWSGMTWRAMGVGTDTTHRYYFLWFSTATDPQPAMPLCSEQPIFVDGFDG